jgi:hypothetical protein
MYRPPPVARPQLSSKHGRYRRRSSDLRGYLQSGIRPSALGARRMWHEYSHDSHGRGDRRQTNGDTPALPLLHGLFITNFDRPQLFLDVPQTHHGDFVVYLRLAHPASRDGADT